MRGLVLPRGTRFLFGVLAACALVAAAAPAVLGQALVVDGTDPLIVRTTDAASIVQVEILMNASEDIADGITLSPVVKQFRTDDGRSLLSAEAVKPTVTVASARIVRLTVAISGAGAAPGTYAGSIVVTDGTQTLGTAKLTVHIRRDNALLAFGLLLLGSVFGAFLKWATDAGLKLGTGYRTLERIMVRADTRRGNLPKAFFEKMASIDVLLRQGKATEANAELDKVAPKLDDLFDGADEIDAIEQFMQVADGVAGRLDPQPAGWPPARATLWNLTVEAKVALWPDPATDQQRRRGLKDAVNVLISRLGQYPDLAAQPILDRVLNHFASGDLEKGVQEAKTIPVPVRAPEPDEARVDGSTSSTPVWTRVWRTLIQGLPYIVAFALAAIIAYWGFDQEYLKKDAFGQLSDYVGLFFWALAIQVAGMTVATALGKVATPSP